MSKIFSRSIHHHGLINNEVPLRRYFLLVGGALLALLFAVDAVAPRQPPAENGNSGPRLPRIRIQSEQKGPEAIVIDTRQAVITPTLSTDAAKTVTPPDPLLAEGINGVGQTVLEGLRTAPPKPQPRSTVGKVRSKRPLVSYAQRRDTQRFDSPGTFGQQDPRIRDSFAQLVPRPPRHVGSRRVVGWAQAEHARHSDFAWFDTGW